MPYVLNKINTNFSPYFVLKYRMKKKMLKKAHFEAL